jgi:hypothetical protein
MLIHRASSATDKHDVNLIELALDALDAAGSARTQQADELHAMIALLSPARHSRRRLTQTASLDSSLILSSTTPPLSSDLVAVVDRIVWNFDSDPRVVAPAPLSSSAPPPPPLQNPSALPRRSISCGDAVEARKRRAEAARPESVVAGTDSSDRFVCIGCRVRVRRDVAVVFSLPHAPRRDFSICSPCFFSTMQRLASINTYTWMYHVASVYV